MKRLFLLLFSLTFVLNVNALVSDSLKNKKIEFMIETGIGVNIFSSNMDDTIAFVSSANRHKISGGVFYNIDREWKLYGGLEYYRIKTYQILNIEGRSLPKRIGHTTDKIKLFGQLYHCLIHDNKSTLYIGLGFGFNYSLKEHEQSLVQPIVIDYKTHYGQITTTNDNRIRGGVLMSLMYEYKFQKIDVGFKIDFTSSNGESGFEFNLSDKENNNIFSHSGNYSNEGMSLETSIFVKF